MTQLGRTHNNWQPNVAPRPILAAGDQMTPCCRGPSSTRHITGQPADASRKTTPSGSQGILQCHKVNYTRTNGPFVVVRGIKDRQDHDNQTVSYNINGVNS